MSPRRPHIASRVSTVELLFDLVFVFTITQVTHVVVEEPDWIGLGKSVVILALVYYMYDGYVWLMNQTAPDSVAERIAMIGAMAAFLVLAAAIPHAFTSSRLVFGIAYLVVILVHLSLFVLRGSSGNARGMFRIGPYNVVASLLVIAAAFFPQGVAPWFSVVALVVILGGTAGRRGVSGFNLGASHLIERHGLLMIIAFGESIVAVGTGLSEQHIDLRGVLACVLAVAIVGGMWWCYFSGDDDRTQVSFGAREQTSRSSLAITAFYGDHLAMIFGLVIFAAGIRLVITDVTGAAPFPAVLLMGGGVGLFLLAQSVFRRELALGASVPRLVGGLAALAVGGVGLLLPPVVELGMLVVVVAGTALWATGSRRATSAESANV
jgi:low temperature requirement protein LtrA